METEEIMIPAYQPVVRRPNVMQTRNPLQQSKSKIVNLQNRLHELEDYKQWH